jgi:hypothetical protein
VKIRVVLAKGKLINLTELGSLVSLPFDVELHLLIFQFDTHGLLNFLDLLVRQFFQFFELQILVRLTKIVVIFCFQSFGFETRAARDVSVIQSWGAYHRWNVQIFQQLI